MSTQHGCFAVILSMVLGLSPALWAQRSDTLPPKSAKIRPGEPATITQEMLLKLASDDAEARKGALEAIKERLGSQSARVLDSRMNVFKTLIAGKHYDEALDLAMHGILVVHTGDAKLLELFQQNRVRVLLAAGRTEEALQNAKSLFNVATMTGTSEAILLVAECINAARPKDKEMFNKFREEQIAGANAPAGATPASLSGAKGTRCTVLDSIKVDPKGYEQARAAITGEDFESLMKRGNLALLADDIAMAKGLFERMYTLAGNSELVEASEALARCMRAEDGTIGRANAWVLSIRPKPATAPAK